MINMLWRILYFYELFSFRAGNIILSIFYIATLSLKENFFTGKEGS